MKKRIPALVSLGFGLLLVFGVATSVFLLLELFAAVKGAKAIDVAGLNLRASVRSLRASYLEIGQEVSTAVLEATAASPERNQRKLEVEASADKLLRQVIAATRSEALRRTLLALQTQDENQTDPIENEILRIAPLDPAAARQLYLTRYLPAQTENMRLVDNALTLAVAEVSGIRAP